MEKIGLFNVNLDINYLKKKILKEENKIIKKYSPTNRYGILTDGGTGLGYDSLTSRHYHFNVLTWFGTKKLKREIKKCYNAFIGVNGGDIYVQCWANVMRNGEKIKPHRHTKPGDRNIICGNLVIQSPETMITYYEGTPVNNRVGALTLFPSTILHWTDAYLGEEERITIAFDIRSYTDWKEDVFDDAKHHWVKI